MKGASTTRPRSPGKYFLPLRERERERAEPACARERARGDGEEAQTAGPGISRHPADCCRALAVLHLPIFANPSLLLWILVVWGFFPLKKAFLGCATQANAAATRSEQRASQSHLGCGSRQKEPGREQHSYPTAPAKALVPA